MKTTLKTLAFRAILAFGVIASLSYSSAAEAKKWCASCNYDASCGSVPSMVGYPCSHPLGLKWTDSLICPKGSAAPKSLANIKGLAQKDKSPECKIGAVGTMVPRDADSEE